MTANEARCERVGHETETAAHCRACAADRLADEAIQDAPMRPAPPPAEITAVAERHRAQVARGASAGRQFAQPAELRPADGPGALRCARNGCGAVYLDYPEARDAHVAIFGHQPA
jgi:hypothetical protein